MSQSNPLTGAYFGLFRYRDRGEGISENEIGRLYEGARLRKGRRDKAERLTPDDFAVGDVVVVKSCPRLGWRGAGRTVYALAEVEDVHELSEGWWDWRCLGGVTVRVTHCHEPEYVGHLFSMRGDDQVYGRALVYCRELSNQEYRERYGRATA